MANLYFEKLLVNDKVKMRKRSSCAISILEWAGGTVLGFEILGAGRETITVARSWLQHRQLYIRQPAKRQPPLTFMGKDSWAPSFFSSDYFWGFCKQSEESY